MRIKQIQLIIKAIIRRKIALFRAFGIVIFTAIIKRRLVNISPFIITIAKTQLAFLQAYFLFLLSEIAVSSLYVILTLFFCNYVNNPAGSLTAIKYRATGLNNFYAFHVADRYVIKIIAIVQV